MGPPPLLSYPCNLFAIASLPSLETSHSLTTPPNLRKQHPEQAWFRLYQPPPVPNIAGTCAPTLRDTDVLFSALKLCPPKLVHETDLFAIMPHPSPSRRLGHRTGPRRHSDYPSQALTITGNIHHRDYPSQGLAITGINHYRHYPSQISDQTSTSTPDGKHS